MSYKRVLGILSFGLALFVNVALAMDAQADAGMNVQLIRGQSYLWRYDFSCRSDAWGTGIVSWLSGYLSQ